MSHDNTDLEEVQWKVYKDTLMANTGTKFLRSAWRKEAPQSKAPEHREHNVMEIKIRKKIKSEKEKKKEKKSTLETEENNLFRLVPYSDSESDDKNIIVKDQMSEEEIESDESLAESDFIDIPIIKTEDITDSRDSFLPFQTVPGRSHYYGANKNGILFNLYEKMRYNKVLSRENFVGRIVIIKSNYGNYVFAKILKFSQNFINVEYLNFNSQNLEDNHFNGNVEEDFNLITNAINGNSNDVVSALINIDETSVFLVEFMFGYHSSDRNTKNGLYAFIISSINYKSDLLLQLDDNFSNNKKVFYSGFITEIKNHKKSQNDFLNLKDISQIDCSKLYNIDILSIKDKLVLKFYIEININFKQFLRMNEFSQNFTIKDNIKWNDYLLHEIIVTKDILNSMEMYLLLKYNKSQESIYVRNYKTGETEWIKLDSELIAINMIKGRALLISLQNKNNKKFYRNLNFDYNNNSELVDNDIFHNLIVINKKMSDNISIFKEFECNICTYKIGEYNYKICKFCNKLFHIECLSNGDRNSQKVNEEFEYWACIDCKPCLICHTKENNTNSLDKFKCSQCHSCYHPQCINPKVQLMYPEYSMSEKGKWKCEKCLKCSNCEVNCESTIENIKFSLNYSYCTECEIRFEKREFCPICMKLWHKDEENMIECKCKIWVHKECDRILSDDFFRRIVKKVYHCPPCRIKKKNRLVNSILVEMINLDENGLFYPPVDLSILNYTKIVKVPMSFRQMEIKSENNIYLQNMTEFFDDVNLIFANTKNYNMPSTNIYKWAEAILPLCQQVLDFRSPELYQTSFEYILFDSSLEDCLYRKEPEKFLKIVEQNIKNKFSDKIEKMKTRINSINYKLNEYKINWSFIKDFIDKNFITNDVTSNTNNFETYSMISENDKVMSLQGNKIIVPKSLISNEEINIQMEEDPEVNENILDFNSNLNNFIIKKESEESNCNNVNLMMNNNFEEIVEKIDFEPESNLKILTSHSSNKFQIKLEDNTVMNLDNILLTNNNIIKKEVLIQSNINSNHNEFIMRKRERGKPKMKSLDFQNELDTYNSNFEVNKKTTNKTNLVNNNSSNQNHKMEINENSIDLFNPFLALEEEEDNLIRTYEKVKQGDFKISYLYATKYKAFINENDKDEYSSYLDMMAGYVCMKEDKRKKSYREVEVKRKNSDSEEYDEDNDEKYEEIKVKGKKGRPIKNKYNIKEEDKVNDSFASEFINNKSLSISNKKVKNNIIQIIENINIDNKIVNIKENNQSNKFKTESELYEENINKKSLHPFPAQVCFSNLDLICEKNCYLCGSFDDTTLFLTCSICYENFHSYCISNSPLITQNIEKIKNYKWKCQNCKFCECCDNNDNDNLLLYCDSCDRALHTYCLDVKLYVVPESGWKCLSCFKCQNCGCKEYYQPSFPVDKCKDYSIFTRNFNNCFECGMVMMFNSFCGKCNLSDFKISNKNLIFIKNKEDFMKNEIKLNYVKEDVKDYTIMLNCNLCKLWFHTSCLGIDELNLNYYFEDYKIFNCLDCHIKNKYKDKYMEVTFIKYLEVLKMSHSMMSFSKLIMTILKSICADSNIKLHSKLLKLYLKENFTNLIKDKNLCLLIELTRIDVFLDRDKNNLENKIKKKKEVEKEKEIDLVNIKQNNKIEAEIEIENLISSAQDLINLEKSFCLENVKMNKFNKQYKNLVLNKFKIDEIRSEYETKRTKNLIFNIDTNGNKNRIDMKYSVPYSDSIYYDNISVLKRIKYSKYIPGQINRHSSNNIHHEIKNEEDTLQKPDEDINMTQYKEINFTLEDIHEEIPTKEIEKKSKFLTNKKRKRISLITERKLNDDLDKFFRNNNNEVKNLNSFDENKFVNFYNFDIEEYYNGGDGYSNKRNESTRASSTITNVDGNQLVTETIANLEKYMKMNRFSKRVQKFIFNLILSCLMTLKQSLLQWMLSQMMNNNETNLNYIQNNNIYQYWVKYQSLNSNLISSENLNSGSTELSEEEINKFLDYIDPLEDSPSRNISCDFCTRKGARKFSGRLLYVKNESWGHINCMLWSKGVQEMTQGNLLNVGQMLNKLKQFKCSFCKKYGATVCCDSRKCGKNYHFACAHAKQCVFTDNRLFFCNRCTSQNSKDESISDFNTHRRFIVARNPDFVNDYKQINMNLLNTNDPSSPNLLKILPKFLVGPVNKFGNTTVLKFLQMNKKDLIAESIDIGIIKFIQKPDLNSDNNFLFLFLLNQSGISFHDLNINEITKFEDFLNRTKLLNCFEKTENDLDSLKEISNKEIHIKIDDINFSVNNYNSKEKNDLFNNTQIKQFNSLLEEYVNTNILTQNEIKNHKKVNKNYNDWMSLFNVNLPFNIIMKYQGLYINLITEVSDTKSNLQGNEVAELKNKKETKSKLETYLNIIKTKNENSKKCFRLTNYIESHQQKIFKKSLAGEGEVTEETVIMPEKKNNTKVNKQTYKNLNKTMSTNIMEMDLPLAMKFRNYKSLKPRVTIGPSAIHRNGLFTIENFQAGEIVIEYVGELITNKIADFREQEYIQRGFGDCYMFRLDKNYIIDATKYGNLARFINHCCDPNCSAQANQIGEKKHIILYAKRPIKANEEITYDYNFETEAEKIMCRCGANNCQGRLN